MAKIKYMGKYSGNPDDLPTQTYREGSVKFKEPETMKKLAIIANIGALIVAVFTLGLFYLRGGIGMFGNFGIPVGFLLVVVTMLPHEYLHAICFKEEVYVYTNLKQGLLFVVGPEAMTKGRFIFMSMLPNLVFGFIPYILYMIWPNLVVLGALGALAIPAGFGDYMNVFNAATQMPKGALTYLYKTNSYWFMPKEA
ncbi:MAG: DUF3267 domain-containing protein [Eubacterium sp.]|nr:DUF3267 domain-containing protein [Eubacterium sp.]